MKKKSSWLDFASASTLAITLVLFVFALFEKGLTHDMLLEAGVFLVSVKLVLGAHKNEVLIQGLNDKINALLAKSTGK